MWVVSLMVLALLAAPLVHAATPLPDACGADAIKFDVSTDKGPLPAGDPGPDSSKIVFIETLHKPANVFVYPTIRMGLDGSWAGAVKGSSYFAASTKPGEHHLCAAWQSHFKTYRDQPQAMQLTVEPGKTYFVAYEVSLIASDGGAQPVISFTSINEDQAKFLLGHVSGREVEDALTRFGCRRRDRVTCVPGL